MRFQAGALRGLRADSHRAGKGRQRRGHLIMCASVCLFQGLRLVGMCSRLWRSIRVQ